MYQNYLTIALRNIARNRLYSAINILGLAIGLAACLLIFLFVRFELSYDDWLPDAERTYRLESTYHVPGRAPIRTALSAAPLRSALEQQMPEIDRITRFAPFWISLTRDNILFNERMVYSDPDILDFIDFTYLEGTKEGALTYPTSIVLTRSIREKYFGDASALGQTVIIDGDVAFTVDAVIEDLPDNTHFLLNVIAPISAPTFYIRDRIDENWGRAGVMTYVRLKDRNMADAVRAAFDGIIERFVPTTSIQGVDIPGSDFIDLRLEPVQDIYLFSDSSGNMKPGGNPNIVYLFTGIAFLILSIAIANFVGLTTARYAERNREVAIRKVLGASRKNLITQFLGEAGLIMLVAFMIAIVLSELVLPWFNSVIGQQLSLQMLMAPREISILALLLGVAILASGIYPAFYLSSVRPASTLSDQGDRLLKPGLLRSVIVFFQFTISVILIVAVTVIYQQTHYAASMDLGFEKDNRLVLEGIRRGPEETIRNARTLRQELLRHSDILAVTASSSVPSYDLRASGIFQIANRAASDRFTLKTMSVGLEFFELYGISPIAGRLLSAQYASDDLTPRQDSPPPTSGNIVVNNSAARQLGFAEPAMAVGQTIRQNQNDGSFFDLTIVGIVPDFKWRSTLDPSEAIIFYSDASEFGAVTLLLADGYDDELLAFIDNAWDKVMPDQQVSRQFLVDMLQTLFLAEETLITILLAFSVLAMIVAGLGLFGLAAFAARRRTREIAIRKVLGASIPDIVRLLILQFSRPVMLANLVAWPIAYIAMSDWLEGFAFRIDITLMPFIFAAFIAFFAAATTVGSHAFNVARANPVHALRYE